MFKDHVAGILCAFPGTAGQRPILEKYSLSPRSIEALLIMPTYIENFSLMSTGSSDTARVLSQSQDPDFITGMKSIHRILHRTNRA